MRGEYDIPGGPRIIVDLEVEGGRIGSALFSGFEAVPGETLEGASRSLVGAPADAGVKDLTALIEGGLAPGGVLVGVKAADLAVAVKRGLKHAVNWRDIDFEIIHGPELDPVVNVALDETLVEDVASGRRRPFMRLWEWNAPQVVIGSFQSYTNEVHPDGVERHGIIVSRRVSGGGAMFMEPANCITFSLVVPTALVEGLSFEQSYPFLDSWVMEALVSVGVKAKYVPLNDIASERGKIGGAAQKRWSNGCMLHHVTMSYDVDPTKMKDVLRTGLDRLMDKGTASAVKHVDPMRSQIDLTRAEIIDAMIRTFAQKYRARRGALSDEDIETAKARCAVKFSTPEWIHRVP